MSRWKPDLRPRPQMLVESFTINPDQGAAALFASVQKPGYVTEKVVRKGTAVDVTFREIGGQSRSECEQD